MKILRQSLVIAGSFAIVFIWQNSFLSDYTIQALGFFIFLYIISSTRKKGTNALNGAWGIFALNTTIFLLIFATGEFTSTLFFLLYFLVFGIAFVFEPATVFVFVLGTALIFLPDIFKDDVSSNLIRVGSLALISPLAYFFGKEFRQREKEEEETDQASGIITKDVQDIIKKNSRSLKPDEIEKLDDILEETEKLREEITH